LPDETVMPDLDRHLRGRTLVLLSNREPYEHSREQNAIQVRQPAGGLVSALDPIMRRTRGVWVAWGSGDADPEATGVDGRLVVPPDDPSYTLRRVWIDAEDIEGYYLGFANQALWPLCHLLLQHFEFRREHWERYKAVNTRFAHAVIDEVWRTDRYPIVWIQDYHFSLVANELRRACPDLFIHQFWHIPFPPPDILRLLPAEAVRELLCGLLGNDLVEFHTERFAHNFVDCVRAFVPEARPFGETLTIEIDGRAVRTGAFPISIDVEQFERLASSEVTTRRVHQLRRRYASDDRALGVSVDRIDYTKGIPRRLDALETLWREVPELRKRFTLIFVATPSRTEITAYRELEERLVQRVEAINCEFGTADWTPIVLVRENYDAEMLAALYRAADLCLVSSLQDGMNLVAKEFIASQIDERGVLVLSQFTGAAEEIGDAVLINPFSIDGFVAGIRDALDMIPFERKKRMHSMRTQLNASTIFDWLEGIMSRCDALMLNHEAENSAIPPIGAEELARPRAHHPVPSGTSSNRPPDSLL
jgi:alpha,alpha-trehalose-phosphate synthase [UDP-forming]